MAQKTMEIFTTDRVTKYLKKLELRLNDGHTLLVGFPQYATYPAGTRGNLRAKYAMRKRPGAMRGAGKGGVRVSMVAAMNEYGDPARGQPPRPFFRNMLLREKRHWGRDLAKLLKVHSSHEALEIMGEEIADELRESIEELSSPPLAPSTVKHKGFSKPLIDTRHMVESITWDVK